MANLQTKKATGLIELIIAFIKVGRPIHWIKNLAIFAALVFSGLLLERGLFITVFWAFWAFNLATSSTYVFNDVRDAPLDRLHPRKRNRPVASGKIPKSWALVYSAALASGSLYWSYSLSPILFYLVLGYLVLQIAYTTVLKNMYIIDILAIASGFMVRVYSGAFIIDAHLSVWFLLCVLSVSLFLASGKRRAELATQTAGTTRKTLKKYPKPLLDAYVTMFGGAAWISWALFTFFESPRIAVPLLNFLAEISRTTTVDKLLMVTIPFAIFGIMRYQALIFEDRSEAPEKILLTDISLVASVLIWTSMVIWILYGGATNSIVAIQSGLTV